MKLATAAVVAAVALTMAPLPSQAFFLNEKAINYKMHIVECFGLLLSDRHAAECGGKVTGPFDTISSQGSPSGPAAAPVVAPVDGGGEKPCWPWGGGEVDRSSYKSYSPESSSRHSHRNRG